MIGSLLTTSTLCETILSSIIDRNYAFTSSSSHVLSQSSDCERQIMIQ